MKSIFNRLATAYRPTSWPSASAWLALPVIIFLMLPSLIVVPLSFSGTADLRFPPSTWSLKWYNALFSSPEWQSAAMRSAAAAVITVLVATPAGLAVTLALRDARSFWKELVLVFVMMPLFVPGVLLGIGVLFAFARLGLNNTFFGLVLAHSAEAMPFVVITLTAGLTQVDRTLETAAQSLGASPMRVLLTVTFPALRTSIATAALFAFLVSFDEIAVSFFISSGDNATLPRRMFSALRDSFDPTIAAISSFLILITTSLMLLSLLNMTRVNDRADRN